MAEFPEVDRAAWYSLDEALEKINKGQRPIIAAALEAAALDRMADSSRKTED
jgi:predicted NUDIX family NTP pyrophosphohydrolase